MSVDYNKVIESIASTLEKLGSPLSEDQRIVMAGAVAVWIEKAKADQRNDDAGIANSHRWNSVGHAAEFCEGFEQGCLTVANAIKRGE